MTAHNTSPFSPLRPGDPREVAGYEIRARIGAGGMGSVYLSFTRGGQPIALKVVRAEFAEDPEFRRRFEAEVQAARRVQGLFTVPVLDSNTEGDAPWLATAFVPGLPLSDVLRDHGPLPLETVLLLVAGVAEALQSIHGAGVIHRDLKPGNVLLAGDGPKVIDFGIARAADATPLTGSDVRIGTPSYMSPEQVTGGSPTTAADVFALGLITHFAATGGHPFGEGAAHALMYRIVQDEPDLSACPEPLRELVAACLAKSPTDRPTPDQVIERCRSLAPNQTLQRSEDWLPSPVASEVTERVRAEPPTSPAAVGATGAAGGAASAASPHPEQPATPPPSGPRSAAPPPSYPPEAPTAQAQPAAAEAAPEYPQTPPAGYGYPPQPAPPGTAAQPTALITQHSAAGAPPPNGGGPEGPAESGGGSGKRRTLIMIAATAVVAAILGGVIATQFTGSGDDGSNNAAEEPEDSGVGDGQAEADEPDEPDEQPEPEEDPEPPADPTDPFEHDDADDGSGSDPNRPPDDPDSEYVLAEWQTELAIRAPVFTRDSRSFNNRCSGANSSEIDMDALSVNYRSSFAVAPRKAQVQYVYCEDTGLIDQGIEFSPELFVGTIDDPEATAEECYEAAHTPTVPNVIPIEDIWEDKTLHEDTGLCFETPQNNVVLLWVDRVTPDPNNKDLRNYLTTVNQWHPR